jgi:hypothetical protein
MDLNIGYLWSFKSAGKFRSKINKIRLKPVRLFKHLHLPRKTTGSILRELIPVFLRYIQPNSYKKKKVITLSLFKDPATNDNHLRKAE